MILHTPGWDAAPRALPWPRAEVHVWRTVLGWPDEAAADFERSLSDDERQRMNRFRFAEDRRRYLVGRGLLRRLLGRYLNLEPHRLRFDYTPQGKPFLAGDSAQRSLQFNVSHSGELLLIGVTDGRALGVDVELIRSDIEAEAIAVRFFSPREREALAQLPAASQVDAFFDCWTRKEAYIKAKGDGLSLPLDQFDVAFMPGETARLLATRPDPAEAQRWSLAALDVAHGYKAALAGSGAGWALKCWDWPVDGGPSNGGPAK